jgi:outer membrane receptor protein involved in Fe transport
MPVVHPKRSRSFLARTPVASAVLLALASPAALAQETSTLGEVIVTAQKREQSLQDVPISIKALDNQTLDELNIQNFKDYVQFLPTVTMAASDGAGSGFSAVYMRGVATGGDGQATTSQPSVGVYLDEQPITTIQGNLDVHLYDIARVEALAGPQGTLYGASSQAGTIRIITNKPDPSGFAAGYGLEGNYVDGNDAGYVAEGFVNLPLSETAAIRLVGWAKHEAGWIDNVHATRLYEGDPETTDDDFLADNAEFVEDDYNTIDTIGARAQLRVNLGENWSVTPSLMYQKMEQEGSWADDLNNGNPEAGYVVPGDQAVAHFRDEWADDEWYQAGLTIEGSIGDWNVVYSATIWTAIRLFYFRYSTGTTSRTFHGYPDNDAIIDPRVLSNADSTRRRATRSGSARRRRIACAACSASSTRSRNMIFTRSSAASGARRTPNGNDPNAPTVPRRRVPEQHGPRGHGPGGVRHSLLRPDGRPRALGRCAILRAGGDGRRILRLRTRPEPAFRARRSGRARRPGQRRRGRLRPGRRVVDLRNRRMALPLASRLPGREVALP